MTKPDPTLPARREAERTVTLEAVEAACRELMFAGDLVTFDKVAKTAGVARNTLFRRPELYEIVNRHVQVQPAGNGLKPVGPCGPLDQLARRWVAGRVDRGELQGKSPAVILGRLRSLTVLHAERPVATLDRAAILVWLASIGDLKPATRRAYVGAVAHFCRWLVSTGHLESDPCTDLPRVRQPRSAPRALPAVEVARIVEACPSAAARPTAEWLRPAIALMVECGLRCVEISRLDLDDYDPELRTLFVRGKDGHERVLPVPAAAVEALGAYLERRPPGPGALLRAVGSKRSPGGRLSAKWISKRTGRAMTAAGVHREAWDRRTAHALRHTAATDVYRRTGDTRIVQQMLGHASLETTQVYLANASVNDLRAAMEGRSYGLDRKAAV